MKEKNNLYILTNSLQRLHKTLGKMLGGFVPVSVVLLEWIVRTSRGLVVHQSRAFKGQGDKQVTHNGSSHKEA